MPLGSSSAAPVMRPGPSLDRKLLRSSATDIPRGYGCLAILFRGSLEALRDDIPFARILAAGRRLGVLHRCEVALQLRNQLIIRAAGKHLGDISTAGPQ